MKKMTFNNEKPYMFVSYKREDKDVVNECIEELRNKYNVNIWSDKFLTAGNRWTAEAITMLRDDKCLGVLFFASMEALTSDPIEIELSKAKDYDKIIIPINFQNKSFKDIVRSDINKKYNRTDTERVNTAERIVDKHLDSRLTYLVLGDNNFYSDLISSLEKNAQGCILLEEDAIGITHMDEVQKNRQEKEIREDEKSLVTNIATIKNIDRKTKGEKPIPIITSWDGNITPETTLEQFELLCEKTEFCLYLRYIRGANSSIYNKQFFDYVMAALLRGCDEKAYQGSARWNYCAFAVAKNVDMDNTTLGASQFTWQSNSRKAVNISGSGKLGQNSSAFSKLDGNISLESMMRNFKEANLTEFITKDNDQIQNVFKVLFT